MPQIAATNSLRTRTAPAVAPSPPVVPGWRLEAALHRGRYCSLWRGRAVGAPPAQSCQYALKLAEENDDADLGRQLLRREAAVSRAVTHPHLLPVLSSHTAQRPAHLVLPYLDGATLAAVRDAHPPLPQRSALWIARQVAEALAALHAAEWLHGDVKPENILVQPDGHATLIDLGFAQRFGQAAPTAAREFRGTLRYVAPERLVSSAAVSGSSDCYSLGVIFFELLAGRPPFDMADAHALAVAHVQEAPPDVRDIVPQTPREANTLVRELLAKNPLRRPTASELVARLCRLEIALLEQDESWPQMNTDEHR